MTKQVGPRRNRNNTDDYRVSICKWLGKIDADDYAVEEEKEDCK